MSLLLRPIFVVSREQDESESPIRVVNVELLLIRVRREGEGHIEAIRRREFCIFSEVVLLQSFLNARLFLIYQQLVLVDGVDEDYAEDEDRAHAPQDRLVALIVIR